MNLRALRSIPTICAKQVLAYRFLLCIGLACLLLTAYVLKVDLTSSSSWSSPVSSSLSSPTPTEVKTWNPYFKSKKHRIRKEQCGKDIPQQVILLTYGRSGSSLTADIIQQQEEVFYYYEPLHNLAKTFTDRQSVFMRENRKYLHLTSIPEYNMRAVDIVERLMTCQYKDLPKVASMNLHMKTVKSTMDMFWCIKNAATTGTQVQCLKNAEQRCKNKSIHFLKIIRLSTEAVGTLMNKHPCLKLIYLVRDPRGSYLSKTKAFNFMTPNTTYEAERYCSRMERDIDSAVRLQKEYPDRVHITRYEYIAEKPQETARKLYDFLKLNFTEEIADYVYEHTMAGKGDKHTYSLARSNSTEVCYAWREKIKFSDVTAFDSQCSDVYYKLGYLPANTERDLRNFNRPLKFDKDIYS